MRRIFVFLTLTAAIQSAAAAADFGWPRTSSVGRQSVPGAEVTIEGGVRVIRPVPFDPAWVASEKTEIPGGIVYRGAAFYRVPGAPARKAAHAAAPKRPDKAPAE